jgi:hypothetical protein
LHMALIICPTISLRDERSAMPSAAKYNFFWSLY